jgi:predicted HTH transcriptional regulator
MQGFSNAEVKEMHSPHALPDKWWTLSYPEFLQKRRELMAGVIKTAYDQLSGIIPETAAIGPTVEELIAAGESEIVEYKSTLRKNLHTGQHDEKIELSALKTIAGFMNAKGGTLIVGVTDAGEALGLAPDGFPSEDAMALHLVNIVKTRMGNGVMPFIHPKFEDFGLKKVLSVKCEAGHQPVFVKDGQNERFYVRSGPSTAELAPSDQHKYIAVRFA